MVDVTARKLLKEVAVEQYGFLTARDARDLNIALTTVGKLVRRGWLDHLGHGIYRFPDQPASEFDSYMAAILWTGVREAA